MASEWASLLHASMSKVKSKSSAKITDPAQFAFDLALSSSYLQYSQQNQCVASVRSVYRYAFGNFEMKSGVHEINFTLNMDNSGYLGIGVCEASRCLSYKEAQNQAVGTRAGTFGVCFYDNIAYCNGQSQSGNYSASNGSTVILIVNFETSQISLKIDRQDYGVEPFSANVFSSKTPLRFAVSASGSNGVRLIHWVNGNIASATSSLPSISSAPPGLKDGSLIKSKLTALKSVKEPLNILVIGGIGSGKSSFINTVLSAFQSDDDQDICNACLSFGSQSDHVTKDIRKFRLAGTHLSLIDVWGYTERNYVDGEFRDMLEGRIGPGFVMGSPKRRGQPGFNARPTVNQKIHAVLLLLDAEETINNASYNKRVSDFLAPLLDLDFRPVCVLTKIDLLDSELASKPGKALDSTDVQNCMSKVSAATGFALKDIYPCKAYSNEYQRSAETEAMAIMAISAAVSSGRRMYTDLLEQERQEEDEIEEKVARVQIGNSRASGGGKNKQGDRGNNRDRDEDDESVIEEDLPPVSNKRDKKGNNRKQRQLAQSNVQETSDGEEGR